MSRRKRSIAVVIVLALAFGGLVIAGSPYRRRLLTAKLSGKAEFSWLEVFRIMLTTRYRWPGPLAHIPSYHKEAADAESGLALWQTPRGAFWIRDRGNWTFLGHIQFEQYLDHIYDRSPVSIRPGDVVVDAGANVGIFTRYALDHGAAVVIAFEPEPANAVCFKKTFREEMKSGRVRFAQAALWDRSDTLRFSEPHEDTQGGSAVFDNRTSWIPVAATTLDSALPNLQAGRIDFIKMDIEGAERKALLGASGTISRFRPRMALSIEHLPDDSRVIAETVRRMIPDYRMTVGGLVLFCY